MTTLADIRTFILADATVTSLIGTRMYPLTVPQNGTMPAVTYQVISGSRGYVFRAPAGMARHRIQFDCYATTYTSAESVAAAIRNRLSGYMGNAGTGAIEAAMFDTERDFYEADVALYRRSVDYQIWIEE